MPEGVNNEIMDITIGDLVCSLLEKGGTNSLEAGTVVIQMA
jgi:hypothetical protein